MRSLSVRARVTLVAAGVLALGLLGVSVGINLLLAARLDSDVSSVLRDRAGAQRATLAVTDEGVRVVDRAGDGVLDQRSWVFEGSRMIERAAAPPEVERAVEALAGVLRPTEREVSELVRLRASPLIAPGGRRVGALVVGVSLQPFEQAKDSALLGTLAFSLLLLLLGAFAVWRAVRSALEPVAEMTRRAAEWGAQDLHRRFEIGETQDELATLAETFNGLLGRIEGVLRHEQRLSAEMAHELRTPLTGLRTEAELALSAGTGDAERRAALERVVSGTIRMTAVIETLLTTARASTAKPRGACDAAVPMDDAAAQIRPAGLAQGIELEATLPTGARVEAPADIVARALAPLLENAVRHAAHRVTLRAERRAGVLAVIVADDGPGLDTDEFEELFLPGASTTGGAGLGLPLARRLARSCGGDVVAVAALGGRFELRLPAAP